MENMCTVTLDGVTTQSDDFVAVLAKENGGIIFKLRW